MNLGANAPPGTRVDWRLDHGRSRRPLSKMFGVGAFRGMRGVASA